MAKGIGKYEWTQTLFSRGNDALKAFADDVWSIWQRPSAEKHEEALRLAFKIEWTSLEKGAEINAKTLTKDKGAIQRKVENPLKDYLK